MAVNKNVGFIQTSMDILTFLYRNLGNIQSKGVGTMRFVSIFRLDLFVLLFSIVISGCGGSGSGSSGSSSSSQSSIANSSSSSSSTSSQSSQSSVASSSSSQSSLSASALSGTAAAGAPIVGQVIVRGALGNRVYSTIEADGSYEIDVSSLTAPYRLRAEGWVGGRHYKIHSYATQADLGGTVNVTPFTDLIIANAANEMASKFFDSNKTAALDATELATQKAALKEKLQTVFTELGVANTIDLLTSAFPADNTQLDAALDMVRVEYDTEKNVATLINLIDNTSMTDSIVDDSADSVGTLEVVSDLSTAQSELAAIINRMKTFAAMIVGNDFTQAQLEAYVGDDFLEDEKSKSQWVTEVTNEDTSEVVLENFVVTDLNMTALTAKVTFTSPWGRITWMLQKISGQWMILGDGKIAEIQGSFWCSRWETASGFDMHDATGACGMHLMVKDNNPQNNYGAGALLSAKVDILREGSPVDGLSWRLGENPNGPGELYPVVNNSQFGGILLDEFNTPVLAGDKFRFQLYDTADVSSGVVATYYEDIPITPRTSSIVADYPSISVATKQAVEAMDTNGGSLTISFEVPSGKVTAQVIYGAWDSNGESIEMSDEGEIPSNSVTFDVDFSSLSGTITQQITVYVYDENYQENGSHYTAKPLTK